jgi:hypothetical protein
MRRYNALRSQIEATHQGDQIAISVQTGRYVVAPDDRQLTKFAQTLDTGDFLWMARIGSI